MSTRLQHNTAMINTRLITIFLLGFSSGLPLALMTSTLQAWFADSGLSVIATGMLSLVSISYLCRPVFGPILDNYSLMDLGLRRGWILVTQLGLVLSFNAMAWLTPNDNPVLLGLFALIVSLLSACQDTAIDAHRIEFLAQKDHGIGTSLAVLGYRLAMFVSGGLALILAQHIGWASMYRLMGLIMVISLAVTGLSTEPIKRDKPKRLTPVMFFTPLKALISRPDFVSLVGFTLFYKLAEAFTTTTSGILLSFLIQELGFSLLDIGYVNKLFGISMLIAGGLAAGFLLKRCQLYYALLVFGLLQALTNSLFIKLALTGKNLTLFAIAVGCDNFAAGLGSTALVVLFMRYVNPRFIATQMSVLMAISVVPRIISGPVAAVIQLNLGWIGLFGIAFILSLGFLPFLYVLKTQLICVDNQNILPTAA